MPSGSLQFPGFGTRPGNVGCANMIAVVFALLQAAAPPADLEFRATVRARYLTIEKQGEARLTLTADGRNVVDVQAPRANGRKTIQNPMVTVNVEARVRDPAVPPASAETPPH